MAKICTIYGGTTDFFDTSLALRYLFKASEHIQKDPHVQTMRMEFGEAYKEYSTISMKASRRTGNTQSIADLCDHLDQHWLILAYNLDIANNTRMRCVQAMKQKILRETRQEVITKKLMLTFGSINSIDIYKGLKLKGIIVDGAEQCEQHYKLENVYELRPCMEHQPSEHFIFVG